MGCSAMSTLDNTLSSTAKLVAVEIPGGSARGSRQA